MNPQDPLAKLHPLREPAAIDWWPPAVGWWLLALLLLALLVIGGISAWRHYRSNRYRRLGVRHQHRLFERYQRTGDTAEFAAATNALLKSVALRAFPDRADIASRHSAAWLEFLNSSAGGNAYFEPALTDAVYRPGDTGLDADHLQRSALHWIKGHRRGQ